MSRTAQTRRPSGTTQLWPPRSPNQSQPTAAVSAALDRLHDDMARARLACELVQFTFGLTCSLLSPTRGTPEQALARQMAMYLTHVGFGMSLQRTAAAFGRDRSTIAHACHKIEDCRDNDAIDGLLELLESSLAQVPAPDTGFLAQQGFSQTFKQAA